MNKRLEKITDEYALELYPDHHYISNYETFKNYYASRHIDWFDSFNSEVSIRYAREVARASLEKASKKLVEILREKGQSFTDQQSVTNLDNIVLV